MLPGIGKGGHPVVEGMESNHWVALDIGKNGHAVFIAKTSEFEGSRLFQLLLWGELTTCSDFSCLYYSFHL